MILRSHVSGMCVHVHQIASYIRIQNMSKQFQTKNVYNIKQFYLILKRILVVSETKQNYEFNNCSLASYTLKATLLLQHHKYS